MKVTPSQATEFYRPRPTGPRRPGLIELDPRLGWADGAAPISERFGDTYFPAADGRRRARHGFLDGAGLPEAWRGRGLYVIGETGFGAGLNFLATWKRWRETAEPDARLHYLAVERYPLTIEQLVACLAPWPELAPLARELAAVYPPPHAGFHRVWLDRGRVALTLLVGDVLAMLAEAEATVDAWFLDGFAPARNPEMWAPDVFTEIARLSAPGARLVTSTTDVMVRSGLEKVGFAIETRRGLAARRAMLVGRFSGAAPRSWVPPWYRSPEPVAATGRIAVLGAGVAGCAVAGALRRRGRAVVLIDRHAGIAVEASGNPAALITPQLGLADNAVNSFYDRAYRMALAQVRETDTPWDGCGALQVFPNGAAARAGVVFPADAAWMSDAGLVEPGAYAERLAGAVDRRAGQAAAAIYRDAGRWRVTDTAGRVIAEAEAMVIAAAHGTTRFEPASWLPLNAVLGQLSMAPASDRSAALRTAVVWGGYLAPARDGRHVLGATYARAGFDPDVWPHPVTAAGHRRNHARLPSVFRGMLPSPGPGPGPGSAGWEGRAAVRCATPDRLPAVGPLVLRDRFIADFDGLRHGPRGRFPLGAVHHPGLFVLAGLGSRGIMTAALSAEILVSQMLGEPWPVERSVALALAPSRFLVRGLRQAASMPNQKG